MNYLLKWYIVCLAIGVSGCYAMEELEKHNAEILKPILEHAHTMVQQNTSTVPSLIAIAGCSGVGKSYLAQELAKLLEKEGMRVAILKLDDFLDPDHYDPDNFHPRLEHAKAHAVFRQILEGKKCIKKPVWNPKEQRSPSKVEELFTINGISLILCEGEFAVCKDGDYNFNQYAQFSVYVDAEDDDILQWNWDRKRSIPEKTQEEFIANNRPYLEKYRAYVRDARSCALYRLWKDKEHRYTLHKGL